MSLYCALVNLQSVSSLTAAAPIHKTGSREIPRYIRVMEVRNRAIPGYTGEGGT